jgi:hypothetical protein
MPISQQFAWFLLVALLLFVVAVVVLRGFSYRRRHPRPMRTANEPRRGSRALASYYRGLSGGSRR